MRLESAIERFEAQYVWATFEVPGLLDAPFAAALLLAEGWSTPTLNYLAGLSFHEGDRVLTPLIQQAGREIGLPDFGAQGGPLAFASLTAQLIANEVIDPYRGAVLIWERILDQLPISERWRYSVFVGLADEWDDSDDRRSVEHKIVEAATELGESQE